MALGAKLSVFKPICREFFTAICHIFTAEHPEPEHLLRGQFRLEFRIKIFPDGLRQHIPKMFLHLVSYDHLFFLHISVYQWVSRGRIALGYVPGIF